MTLKQKILLHTVQHKADMFAVQLHKLCLYQLGGVVVPGNAYRRPRGADGFQHNVHKLVQPVPANVGIGCENVIADILHDDLPVNF